MPMPRLELLVPVPINPNEEISVTLTRAEHRALLEMCNAARVEIITGLSAYFVGEERIALLRRVLGRAPREGQAS